MPGPTKAQNWYIHMGEEMMKPSQIDTRRRMSKEDRTVPKLSDRLAPLAFACSIGRVMSENAGS